MKIHEIIITSCDSDGNHHVAPMGINIIGENVIIKPFKPSKTLDNLLQVKQAVVNFVEDVRVFAGIVTREKTDWSLEGVDNKKVNRLSNANSYYYVDLDSHVNHEVRPELKCIISHKESFEPFLGFNRAQFSVIEASVLTSRLGMIPLNKIKDEINYLKIGLDKTAGEKELEAWNWIEKKIRIFEENNNDS